jgi:hypothetical protein
LVLAAVTAAIYLFVNPKGNSSTSYNVDKYSDIVNWCDTSLKDGKLSVDCKALLINIDTNSCFEVQVITKDKELKDLNVCEKNDNLSYTNDVLDYKKLMPVDMVFTYTKEGVLGNYSFSNVSFTKVDDTYIQSIVNEDIADLVTIDPSSTTIQNSVDFCPRPEILPSYVTDTNKTSYTDFYSNNLLNEKDYSDSYFYNLDDTIIRILFSHDSQSLRNNATDPKAKIVLNVYDIEKSLTLKPNAPKWGKEMDKDDNYLLKQISLLYDNSDLIKVNKEQVLNSIIDNLNMNANTSEQVYCGLYKLLTQIKNPSYDQYTNLMRETVDNNTNKITSKLCFDISEKTDIKGSFIKIYINNKINDSLKVMSICSSLNEIITNL